MPLLLDAAQMEEIGVIVFDECHHATKAHPYNRVMQEFYFMTEKHNRPKIFGLTASPIQGMNDTATSFKQLEDNLDSKVGVCTLYAHSRDVRCQRQLRC
jgi:ERCC4-related helicase